MQKINEQWLNERKKGVGGSDVQDVLSLAPYGCAARLFDEKRSVAPDFDVPRNPNMERGVMLEDIVCEIYAQKTGDKLTKSPALKSKEYSFMLGNVDRFIEMKEPKIEGLHGNGILEVKCPNRDNFLRIKRLGLPESYILQLQHYMYVADKRWAVWAIFCADLWELLPISVTRDDELIQMVIEEEEKFWRMVEIGPRPERLALGDKRCKKCCRRISCWKELWKDEDEPEGVEDDYEELNTEEFVDAFNEHIESKDMVKDTEVIFEKSKQKLIDIIGEKSLVKCSSGKLRYKWEEKTYVDSKRLKAEKLEVYKEYSNKSGSIVFRFYPKKGA